MNKINTDILELISEHLDYEDIFSINILSKKIHKIFKCCKFSNRAINIKRSKISKLYSFTNIIVENINIVKYLDMKKIKRCCQNR